MQSVKIISVSSSNSPNFFISINQIYSSQLTKFLRIRQTSSPCSPNFLNFFAIVDEFFHQIAKFLNQKPFFTKFILQERKKLVILSIVFVTINFHHQCFIFTINYLFACHTFFRSSKFMHLFLWHWTLGSLLCWHSTLIRITFEVA